MRTLEELRAADLPRATVATSIEGDVPPELRPLLEEVLSHYVADGSECPCCGAGAYAFVWGLHHGRGSCSSCGWPATLYHFVTDAEGKTVARFVVLLYAHPSEVERSRGRG